MAAATRILATATCLIVITFMCQSSPVWCQDDKPAETTLEESREKFLQLDLRTLTDHPPGLPEIEEIDEAGYLRIDLGRQLFFDPLLSSDGSTSCATCHQPEFAFATPDQLPSGVGGRKGRRNAPSLVNRRWSTVQFWDGRAASLEEQALQPIESENELDSSIEEVLEKIQRHPRYSKLFAAIYDEGVTRDNLADAIVSFERVLLSADSPIDRFVAASDEPELSRSERQGLWIYESKGGCWQCHSGQNYTDEKLHNTGVSWGKEPLDLGYFEVTEDEQHKGQFKTPTLRDVALTGPYMHDGSIKTLREVIEFYNRGGTENPHLDSRIKPLDLTEQEMVDLEAFLRALTGRHVWD